MTPIREHEIRVFLENNLPDGTGYVLVFAAATNGPDVTFKLIGNVSREDAYRMFSALAGKEL